MLTKTITMMMYATTAIKPSVPRIPNTSPAIAKPCWSVFFIPMMLRIKPTGDVRQQVNNPIIESTNPAIAMPFSAGALYG